MDYLLMCSFRIWDKFANELLRPYTNIKNGKLNLFQVIRSGETLKSKTNKSEDKKFSKTLFLMWFSSLSLQAFTRRSYNWEEMFKAICSHHKAEKKWTLKPGKMSFSTWEQILQLE